MNFVFTALVIQTAQNSVSHPSLQCYTHCRQYKKLICCNTPVWFQCFSHATQSEMSIKLQLLLLKQNSQVTPRSTVRPVKLPPSQLIKKFPAFYGTHRFITHLSLSLVRPIQSTPSYPNIPSYLCLGLQNRLFPSSFPMKSLTVPHLVLIGITCHMPRPSHSSGFHHPNNIWRGVQIIKLLFR
jgi:hypothetical protein